MLGKGNVAGTEGDAYRFWGQQMGGPRKSELSAGYSTECVYVIVRLRPFSFAKGGIRWNLMVKWL